MSAPGVSSAQIEGFLSIRSATVELGRLNVLVGANGAGKTNVIRLFEVLERIASGNLAQFVGLNGGASAHVNDRSRGIGLVVQTGAGRYRATLAANANDELVFLFESATGDLGTPVEKSGGARESFLLDGAATGLRSVLSGFRVFNFHDTSRRAAVKQNVPTADNLALHGDAGNLAAVLLYLSEADPVAYRRIVGAVRLVAPFFHDFVLQPEASDRVRLRWRQVDSETTFSAHQMSDGTLRFACLATLLLQPQLPALVLLDEPELGLHPFAITQLADLLRQAAARSQVLFATQSVTLISQFDLGEVIVAEREDGASVFRRPDPQRLVQWLSDYSLGELWEKNLLGGGPRRERRGVDG